MNLIDFLLGFLGISSESEVLQSPAIFLQEFGFTILLALLVLTGILTITYTHSWKRLHNPLQSVQGYLQERKKRAERQKANQAIEAKKKHLVKLRERQQYQKRIAIQKEEARIHRKKILHKKILGIRHSWKQLLDKVNFKHTTSREQPTKKIDSSKKIFLDIKAKHGRLPKDSKGRVKLEVAIARALESIHGSFSITEVMKKIDELFGDQLERKDRIEFYDELKSLVQGELCQKVHSKLGIARYKFV